MGFERWGSLSVSDHVDTYALIANVLLYDRLIVPVMTPQPDRKEEEYWKDKGWNPDLQKKRLEELDTLAVRRNWDATLRERYSTRSAQLSAEKADAAAMHPTRRLLAEQPVDKPAGVQEVQVIAAYSSLSALRDDFDATDSNDGLGAQALLVTRRLRVPAEKNPEDSLRIAVALSRDQDFQTRRTELFDWQQTAQKKRLAPKEAVDYLVELVGRYNEKVDDAKSKVETRFAFTVASATLGFFTGGPVGAGVGAGISLLQFATLDRQPAVEAGSLAPVAMFHDIEVKLGYRLT